MGGGQCRPHKIVNTLTCPDPNGGWTRRTAIRDLRGVAPGDRLSTALSGGAPGDTTIAVRQAARRPSEVGEGRAEPRSVEQLRPRSGPFWPVSAHVRPDPRQIYDIFERTKQIQQLVIARAISGRHIA